MAKMRAVREVVRFPERGSFDRWSRTVLGCPYCDEFMIEGPNAMQGRSAHIRKVHPGQEPYPKFEEIVKSVMQPVPEPEFIREPEPVAKVVVDHNTVALRNLIDSITLQVDEIEVELKKLEGLREECDRLRRQKNILENALNNIEVPPDRNN